MSHLPDLATFKSLLFSRPPKDQKINNGFFVAIFESWPEHASQDSGPQQSETGLKGRPGAKTQIRVCIRAVLNSEKRPQNCVAQTMAKYWFPARAIREQDPQMVTSGVEMTNSEAEQRPKLSRAAHWIQRWPSYQTVSPETLDQDRQMVIVCHLDPC